MTPDQFWNSEPYVFYAYEKAYITRLHNESHIRGLYINTAFSVVLSNMFADNKSKVNYYPKEPIFSPYHKDYSKEKAYREMSQKDKDKARWDRMARWKV